MRKQQHGVSLMGLIFILFIIVVVALFAMKTAIDIIARTTTNASDARRAWQARSAIDNINSISEKDLEISRDGNQLVIGFAYRKEVSLFGPVGLYIDYAATSKGGP
jgi:type II secretory pathway component PulK